MLVVQYELIISSWYFFHVLVYETRCQIAAKLFRGPDRD
jgi:hypothetical protein